MKIGQFENKPSVATVATERKGTAGEGVSRTDGATSPEPSAKVELSAAASQLGAGAGAGTPDFDAEKVERVSQAIREGRFQINPEAIADKLISNAAELLGRASH
ncbi:MAG TPA: flagellar biosynthesis anti-sigma factor FlgM [Burkholderiaceae bacterium]|nr:flagellar biosynthesis anti-sigma factor FlgM [Burkholderiaceae bacterium]